MDNLKGLISKMTDDELREAISLIKQEIERRKEDKGVYRFYFEHSNDPRKGVPYAARLVMKDGKLEREFFDLDKDYGKKIVTVSGDFEAKEGEIIEQRVGGSWKNDYRYLYLVKNGELVRVGDSTYSPDIVKVKKYLKGEITANQLVGEEE